MALLPMLLVAGLLATILVSLGYRLMSDENELRAAAVARQLASSLTFSVVSGNQELMTEIVGNVMRFSPDTVAVIIQRPDGSVLYQSGTRSKTTTTKSSANRYLEVTEPLVAPNVTVEDFYSGTKPSGISYAAPPIGRVTVIVDRQRLLVQRDQQILMAIALALGGALLGTVIVARITRRIREQIRNAISVVQQIGRGELGARMPLSEAGPLDELVVGINQMGRQIEFSQNALQDGIAHATAGLVTERDVARRSTLAKTQFLAAASHDLRQPLHALSLFVTQARSSMTAAERQIVMAQIESSVHHLQELLDGLLDLSRMETGEFPVRLENIDVSKILGRVCDNLAPIAGAKGLPIHCSAGTYWICSDPQLVERIALNLVGNAVRYSHRGGVLVTCRRRGNSIRVQVWDTGIGIAADKVHSIFDDYTQIGNEERAAHKGLGLGLAICRRAALLLGTEIGVHSVPGRGSVFWFDLPQGNPPPVTAAASLSLTLPAAAPEFSGTCLVVDSDPQRTTHTLATLRQFFKAPLHAKDETDARHLCRTYTPALLLCSCTTTNVTQVISMTSLLGSEFPAMQIIALTVDLDASLKEQLAQSGLISLKLPLIPGRLRAVLAAGVGPVDPSYGASSAS